LCARIRRPVSNSLTQALNTREWGVDWKEDVKTVWAELAVALASSRHHFL